jgi:hypothetical protein
MGPFEPALAAVLLQPIAYFPQQHAQFPAWSAQT